MILYFEIRSSYSHLAIFRGQLNTHSVELDEKCRKYRQELLELINIRLMPLTAQVFTKLSINEQTSLTGVIPLCYISIIVY